MARSKPRSSSGPKARCQRAVGLARRISRADSSASITVLPVTWIGSGSTPSRSRLSRGRRSARSAARRARPTIVRLTSSGNGSWMLPVRSPASTWPDRDAAVEGGERAGHAVVVSPWTSTKSGRSARSTSRRPSRAPVSDVEQVLVRAHQVEIVVGRDAESVEHLVEHLAVLAGDADARAQRRASSASAWTTGAILMASGRVPKTDITDRLMGSLRGAEASDEDAVEVEPRAHDLAGPRGRPPCPRPRYGRAGRAGAYRRS